jgi:hypothetical protein
MDVKKSQSYNYTHETIPIMWHHQTDDFIKYLDKDGIKFLRFWWKHLVDNLGITISSSGEGLGYEIKEMVNSKGKPVKIVFITMPKPVSVGEVYYLALIKFPKQTTVFDMFMTRLPTTKIFTLEYEGIGTEDNPKTGFYEMTVRAHNIRQSDGFEPVYPTFCNHVIQSLKL